MFAMQMHLDFLVYIGSRLARRALNAGMALVTTIILTVALGI